MLLFKEVFFQYVFTTQKRYIKPYKIIIHNKYKFNRNTVISNSLTSNTRNISSLIHFITHYSIKFTNKIRVTNRSSLLQQQPIYILIKRINRRLFIQAAVGLFGLLCIPIFQASA